MMKKLIIMILNQINSAIKFRFLKAISKVFSKKDSDIFKKIKKECFVKYSYLL